MRHASLGMGLMQGNHLVASGSACGWSQLAASCPEHDAHGQRLPNAHDQVKRLACLARVCVEITDGALTTLVLCSAAGYLYE